MENYIPARFEDYNLDEYLKKLWELFYPLEVKASIQFISVAQSCPTLCDPMIAARQASLSITISQSSLSLTSIESVMPFSHLIHCF